MLFKEHERSPPRRRFQELDVRNRVLQQHDLINAPLPSPATLSPPPTKGFSLGVVVDTG